MQARRSASSRPATPPAYEIRLLLLWEDWQESLAAVELPVVGNVFADLQLPGQFTLGTAFDFAAGTLQRVLVLVTDTFLVMLILVFILAEAAVFRASCAGRWDETGATPSG